MINLITPQIEFHTPGLENPEYRDGNLIDYMLTVKKKKQIKSIRSILMWRWARTMKNLYFKIFPSVLRSVTRAARKFKTFCLFVFCFVKSSMMAAITSRKRMGVGLASYLAWNRILHGRLEYAYLTGITGWKFIIRLAEKQPSTTLPQHPWWILQVLSEYSVGSRCGCVLQSNVTFYRITRNPTIRFKNSTYSDFCLHRSFGIYKYI